MKPDAILTDSPGFSVTYAHFLGKLYNIPNFIWLRGDYKEEYNETLMSMKFLEKMVSTLKLQLSDIFVKKTTALLTVSDYLKNEITHELKIPNPK